MTSKERIDFALSISTDTKLYLMGSGEYVKAPAAFRRFFPGRKAVILADVHTWPACTPGRRWERRCSGLSGRTESKRRSTL